ncbi:hypothetical protein ElyMa_003449200 [Elysia marginata]|uniref:Uncharacterized protein n=1 Tax=Elysia marginata TaxID=1093978 RepID=A0AAV4JWL8_9GAST|nr:hypothetical protein ElyMa_003449200 [Elysia marginata]
MDGKSVRDTMIFPGLYRCLRHSMRHDCFRSEAGGRRAAAKISLGSILQSDMLLARMSSKTIYYSIFHPVNTHTQRSEENINTQTSKLTQT